MPVVPPIEDGKVFRDVEGQPLVGGKGPDAKVKAVGEGGEC